MTLSSIFKTSAFSGVLSFGNASKKTMEKTVIREISPDEIPLLNDFLHHLAE